MLWRNNLFLVIILTLFMFVGINRVNAATGLYCIYGDDSSITPNLMLVQDNTGSKYVYAIENQGEAEIKNLYYDSFSWQKVVDVNGNFIMNKAISDFSSISSDYLDQNNNFVKCPDYYIYKNNIGYKDYYFSTNSWESGTNVGLNDDLSGTYDGVRSSDDFQIAEYPDTSDYIVDESNYTFDTYTTQWLVEPTYEQSCLYTYKYSEVQIGSVQFDISFSKKKVRISTATIYPINDAVSSCDSGKCSLNVGSRVAWQDQLHFNYASVNSDYYYTHVEMNFNNTCPYNIFVKQSSFNTDLSYRLGASSGDKSYVLTNSLPEVGGVPVIKNSVIINDCENLLGSELIEILHVGVNIVKILIPIILIGLGIVDFAQATFGTKEDDMKKASSRFVRRIIIAIVIFLIPDALKILLSIADAIWGVVDPSLCGIL